MITALCCRGIGEDRGVNMLTNTTQLLDPARFVVKQVPWEASYGPVPDPGGSRSTRRCPKDARFCCG